MIPKPDAHERYCLDVDPGACGFTCRIEAFKTGRRSTGIHIRDSECAQIQRLAEMIRSLNITELFMPLTKNPVYMAAQKVGCHASCIIPAAILKVAEAAMGMAVAKNVHLTFMNCETHG